MRLPIAAVMVALATPAASGQLVFVEFKSDKIAKRYAKNLSTYRGRDVVIGEPKDGIRCEPGKVNYTGGAEAKNSLYVGDPGDPSFCPYKLVDGVKEKDGKRSEIQFAGDDIRRIAYVDRLQTLHGLAQEYERRDNEIEAIREKRDDFKKGTTDWFNQHGLLIGRYDNMISWLNNLGYPKFASKLERRVDKERKEIAKEATAIREKTAIDSIQDVETPERLVEAAKEHGAGRTYSMVESQHVRITYCSDLPERQAHHLIGLAEQVIEGFRKEFVDPYLDEDFKDRIPDHRFVEFYFGPDDMAAHENMYVKYYGGRWREPKERSLKSGGTWLGAAGISINYWRLGEDTDLDGIITHGMGHMLCQRHFAAGRGDPQPWLQEALGYYVSFGFLGRNSVTCFNWQEKRYDFIPTPEGEKTVQTGLRGHFSELARAKGPSLEALAVKSLHEITDADFAKAWSFFDWVARTQEKTGQKWLRATCLAATDRGNFISRWRALSEETFGVEAGTDVFAELDKRWREFAETSQME